MPTGRLAMPEPLRWHRPVLQTSARVFYRTSAWRLRRTLKDQAAPRSSREELRSERVRDLRQALERLPYEQREVVILRHLAGLSPREIADILDKSEASIHGLHHRARNAFKAALRELEATPLTKS